jgi:hypothetical protein
LCPCRRVVSHHVPPCRAPDADLTSARRGRTHLPPGLSRKFSEPERVDPTVLCGYLPGRTTRAFEGPQPRSATSPGNRRRRKSGESSRRAGAQFGHSRWSPKYSYHPEVPVPLSAPGVSRTPDLQVRRLTTVVPQPTSPHLSPSRRDSQRDSQTTNGIAWTACGHSWGTVTYPCWPR